MFENKSVIDGARYERDKTCVMHGVFVVVMILVVSKSEETSHMTGDIIE